jgi:hypothetical protein
MRPCYTHAQHVRHNTPLLFASTHNSLKREHLFSACPSVPRNITNLPLPDSCLTLPAQQKRQLMRPLRYATLPFGVRCPRYLLFCYPTTTARRRLDPVTPQTPLLASPRQSFPCECCCSLAYCRYNDCCFTPPCCPHRDCFRSTKTCAISRRADLSACSSLRILRTPRALLLQASPLRVTQRVGCPLCLPLTEPIKSRVIPSAHANNPRWVTHSVFLFA